MSRRNPQRLAVALTIAGSDSGGGAGIQADLKTFASVGVHGTCAVTCITAQNPKRILGIQVCRPGIVRRQIEAVLEEFHPSAAKTGMLHSREIIRAVADFFRPGKGPVLIVDPVMVSTSGTRLLARSAIGCLQRELLPLAALVMPNLSEAEVLSGIKLKSIEDMRRAAREIHRRFGCAALVKGGHLAWSREAVDIFYDGHEELMLAAPFVRGVRAHGTGCTYSAAVTGYVARGYALPEAVARSKEHISQAILQRQFAYGHAVLKSFWFKVQSLPAPNLEP